MTRKTTFFERWSWFKFNNLGLALGTKLEILDQSVKKVKTKSQKVLGANSYVCRSYSWKTGRGGLFALPPSWRGLSQKYSARKYAWHRFRKGERSWKDSKQNECLCRSSSLKDSYKGFSHEGVMRNFSEFTRKHLCQSPFLGVLWILGNLQKHLFCRTAPGDCFWL